jgi:riboflavin synthase
MFTGIIEAFAKIVSIENKGTNRVFILVSALANQFKVDQSVSHNGVCLTVESIDLEASTYQVTAIKETLDKSNLGLWAVGDLINLERSLLASQRLDGHFVQGHVDTTATCVEVLDMEGSWVYRFAYAASEPHFFTVPKGSICINGVSLTVSKSEKDQIEVSIIPYTYAHTNFHKLTKGSVVNLEFDILGKYMLALTQNYR